MYWIMAWVWYHIILTTLFTKPFKRPKIGAKTGRCEWWDKKEKRWKIYD